MHLQNTVSPDLFVLISFLSTNVLSSKSLIVLTILKKRTIIIYLILNPQTTGELSCL